MRNAYFLVVVVFLFLPVACGGGSGGGVAKVTITGQNAVEVASVLFGGRQFVDDFTDVVLNYVELIETGQGSGTFPCFGGGGDYTVDLNDVPPIDEISTGDSASIIFDRCVIFVDGEMITVSGRLDFTVSTFTDLPPDGYQGTIVFTFTNLGLVSTDETITVNGGLTVDLDTPDDIDIMQVIRGSSFRGRIQDIDGTHTATFSNFRHESTWNEISGAFTGGMRGTLYHSDMAGQVDYETTTVFAGMDPNPPDQGIALVTGGGGTTMIILVQDAVDVLLEVDGDGDGTPEAMINTTWVDLDD